MREPLLQDMSGAPLDIGVIGSGISGLAAAWLLGKRHRVTLYESRQRPGGHSNTVGATCSDGEMAIDTGFIVYNEATYPNLTALFEVLSVPTQASDMSFSVSLDDGRMEYSGGSLAGLCAQKRNLFRPRFWTMLRDLERFYREASRDLPQLDPETTLGDYLDARGYGDAFLHDHLLPMAAAIWSAPTKTMLEHSAAAFIRFFDNHGLLRLSGQPQWRSVAGGSRTYVERMTRDLGDGLRLGAKIKGVRSSGGDVVVRDGTGATARHDHVVIATHADQALSLLDDATHSERALLGAFGYSRNLAVLHSDPSFMPKRRAAWSAWNFRGWRAEPASPAPTVVTYWMNALQRLPGKTPFFVTLNPQTRPGTVWHEEIYEHPVFDVGAAAARKALWSLQGKRRLWFCGAYFGAGFHEDGLQSALAVAEALGGVRRPWNVPNESSRIVLVPAAAPRSMEHAA